MIFPAMTAAVGRKFFNAVKPLANKAVREAASTRQVFSHSAYRPAFWFPPAPPPLPPIPPPHVLAPYLRGYYGLYL